MAAQHGFELEYHDVKAIRSMRKYEFSSSMYWNVALSQSLVGMISWSSSRANSIVLGMLPGRSIYTLVVLHSQTPTRIRQLDLSYCHSIIFGGAIANQLDGSRLG